MELFLQSVRTFNSLEKVPHKAGAEHSLYHSERHLMDMIGDQPGVNITEFARSAGVTKGAVSQLVKKLERKGLVRRYKSSSNDKEVLLELTREGREFCRSHKRKNEETIKPLIEELERHPDDKIDFLISMFEWINAYLGESGRRMKR